MANKSSPSSWRRNAVISLHYFGLAICEKAMLRALEAIRAAKGDPSDPRPTDPGSAVGPIRGGLCMSDVKPGTARVLDAVT